MKSVARAMRDVGLDVKLVKEEFREGVPDVEWLPPAIANGWILLAKTTDGDTGQPKRKLS